MSKRQQRRVVLADFKAKKRDEGAIEIEGENGETFRVDPPALWPDEVLRLAAGDNRDPIGLGKILLGDDGYERFIAAGGSAALLDAIIGEELGLSAGESSASSSS